jgi:hypothetical protein
MFLWAKLVMDELKLRQCVNDLRDGAKNLPDGLQEAYVILCLVSCFTKKTNQGTDMAMYFND